MVGRDSKRDSSQKIFYTLITLRSNMTKCRQEPHRAVWSKSAGPWIMKLYGHFLLCAFVSVDIIYNKIIIQRSDKCCVYTLQNCTISIIDLDITKWFPKTDILHHVCTLTDLVAQHISEYCIRTLWPSDCTPCTTTLYTTLTLDLRVKRMYILIFQPPRFNISTCKILVSVVFLS